MDEKQKNNISNSANLAIRLLKIIKEELYNNNWPTEFNLLVEETIDKLCWDVETLLLHPNMTFQPLTRTFSAEDEHKRFEIKYIIAEAFDKFRKTE